MASHKSILSIAVLCCVLPAQAAGSAEFSLDSLPYRDPAPLEAMVAMDDERLQQMLSQRWPEVESLLYQYIPKGAEIFPAPRSFYGPWKSCLQSRAVAACREHMSQLIALEKRKAGQSRH